MALSFFKSPEELRAERAKLIGGVKNIFTNIQTGREAFGKLISSSGQDRIQEEAKQTLLPEELWRRRKKRSAENFSIPIGKNREFGLGGAIGGLRRVGIGFASQALRRSAREAQKITGQIVKKEAPTVSKSWEAEARKFKTVEEFIENDLMFQGGAKGTQSNWWTDNIASAQSFARGEGITSKGRIADGEIRIIRFSDIPKKFTGGLSKSEYIKEFGTNNISLTTKDNPRILYTLNIKEGNIKSQLTDIFNKEKEVSQPLFTGTKDLSTRLLEEFKGLPETIKTARFNQVINQAKKSGVRQVDEDLVRASAVIENSKVNLTKTGQKIEEKLVPLTSTSVKSPRHSNVGSEFMGDGKYFETVYESPVKTSAGDVHFQSRSVGSGPGRLDVQRDAFPNYFSHTRGVVLPDGKGVKYLEWQSDLFQKGRLERELGTSSFSDSMLAQIDRNLSKPATELIDNLALDESHFGTALKWSNSKSASIWSLNPEKAASKMKEIANELGKLSKRKVELSQLQPYNSNDPLAHLRMVREELKNQAKAGKEYVLTPKGKTAMEIEGLTSGVEGTIEPGNVVRNRQTGEDWYVISKSQGQYEAIPEVDAGGASLDDVLTALETPEYNHISIETFDVSATLDEKHFIYKLNEKAIPDELKKLGLKVTDQGDFWRVDGIQSLKDKPTLALGKANIGAIIGGATATGLGSLFVPSKPETFERPKQSQIKLKKEPQGNIAQRHNNPGNLVFRGQKGATKGEAKEGGGHWAKFRTLELGREAGQNDIKIKLRRKPNMTLGELIEIRSPASENILKDIRHNVIDELWDLRLDGSIPRLNKFTRVKDIPLDRLEQALSKAEGFED